MNASLGISDAFSKVGIFMPEVLNSKVLVKGEDLPFIRKLFELYNPYSQSFAFSFLKQPQREKDGVNETPANKRK